MRGVILCLSLFFLHPLAHADKTTELGPFEMAITIDDLPFGHDAIWTPDQNPTSIEKKMLEVFKKHKLKNIYAFTVSGDINDKPENKEIINRWVEQGHKLSNHTFAHPAFSSTSASDYIAGIERNNAYLQKNWPGKYSKIFRYPYLQEGNTLEKREKVRAYLKKNNYKIGQVTIDFADPKLNNKYIKALLDHDQKTADFQKSEFLRKAAGRLYEASANAKKYFQRNIKHILLLHLTQLTSEMLDQMLSRYEELGVRFIALEEALADPAYAQDPNIPFERGLTFLEQLNLKHTGDKNWKP